MDIKITGFKAVGCGTAFKSEGDIRADISDFTAIDCGTVFDIVDTRIALTSEQAQTLRMLAMKNGTNEVSEQVAEMRKAGLPDSLLKILSGAKTAAELVKVVWDMFPR